MIDFAWGFKSRLDEDAYGATNDEDPIIGEDLVDV